MADTRFYGDVGFTNWRESNAQQTAACIGTRGTMTTYRAHALSNMSSESFLKRVELQDKLDEAEIDAIHCDMGRTGGSQESFLRMEALKRDRLERLQLNEGELPDENRPEDRARCEWLAGLAHPGFKNRDNFIAARTAQLKGYETRLDGQEMALLKDLSTSSGPDPKPAGKTLSDPVASGDVIAEWDDESASFRYRPARAGVVRL